MLYYKADVAVCTHTKTCADRNIQECRNW